MPLIASFVLLTIAALPIPALAWNIPGHMLSAAIRLSGSPARESPNYREGKSSVGETPLVREPMAGETSKPSPVTGGGLVTWDRFNA
jgi:hypothetical protein